MKTTSSFIILIMLAIIISGCQSFVPFTAEHHEIFKYRLNDVQFYTSDPIVLRRDIIVNRTHQMRIESNKKYIEIVIPQNTPCILQKEDKENNILHVQCEPSPDAKTRTIPFALKQQHKDIPEDLSKYVYQFNKKEIIYEGAMYRVVFEEKGVPVSKDDMSVYVGKTGKKTEDHYIRKNLYPILTVDLEEHRKMLKHKRILPGLKIEKND